MNYQDRISIEPGKRGGKPCIRGMRITVYDVLEYLASGMSEQDILDSNSRRAIEPSNHRDLRIVFSSTSMRQ